MEDLLGPGETFPVHFVWRLPNDDYLRAVYEAHVLAYETQLDRYFIRLGRLVAGRQEDLSGAMRPVEDYDRGYWAMAGRLRGRRLKLAVEVADGRPLLLRVDTLTGQHAFFFRFDPLEEEE